MRSFPARFRGFYRGTVQAQAGRGYEPLRKISLNRAADAILKLKSAQFTLTREGTPAFLDEKNGDHVYHGAQCSYAAPDRVSCNVKIASKNGTILQLTRVWVPEGTFQTNPLTRQFGKAPADASFNGVLLFARTGIPEILRTSVQKPPTRPARDDSRTRARFIFKGEVSGEKLNPLIGGVHAQAGADVSGRSLDGGAVRQPGADSRHRARGQRLADRALRVNEPVDIPTPKLAELPADTQA